MPVDFQLRIAVCDDDREDLKKIVKETAHILGAEGVGHRVFTFSDSTSLLEQIRCGESYDLLLLDVIMGEMNGVELAAALRKQQDQTAVIFISSNREMAMLGYEVSALRYLAKPLDREKLREALLCYIQGMQGRKELLLPTEDGQYRVALADIQYLEAFDRGTRFILREGSLDSKLKFSQAQALLPDSTFLLCHRAYIVNLYCVKRIHTNEFELLSGVRLPISKYRYQDVRKQFVSFVTDQ